MAFSSSSSSSIPQNKYDVFLSFRGEDTRNNFTSHLYSALCRKQIQTFIDNQLVRGDEISPSLLKGIEGSDISVVVFSEGYASSRWCLDELVKILECKNKYGQIVIPVFYHVDPSHVRNQTDIFGNSFSKLEERFQHRLDKPESWRNALRETANLSGFHSQANRTESELIEEIVNNVLERRNKKFESYDNDLLIGVESVIKKIESVLSSASTSIYSVGIWGIGGIGKTTIAKAIFRKISSHFGGSCFIENVREEEVKNKGLDHLQRHLFSTLLEDENVNVAISKTDYNFERLRRKKILVVFDDVTCFKQIESLIGSFQSFGEGSRIIITSRDRQVLKNCRVDEINKVKELSHNDALKLFNRHGFGQIHPKVGFEELSNKIIEYVCGVPLALKVLGCFLFEREKEEWESAIEKLKRIPNEDIQKVLKISYDGLDHVNKNIFLDIACFFKGEDKDSTMRFLDVCDFYPKIGIAVLVDKCMITISNNKITMHDLLQEMGREIVRQESTDDPGKRSRLWHHEDIYKVLTYNTGTDSIQGISLNMSKVDKIRLDSHTFTRMSKLRFFKFYGENKCKLSHFHSPVFTEVRYLHWQAYPLKSLPESIHLENLVSLKLSHSNIEHLWKGVKNLSKLRHLDLSHSRKLTKLSNLSRAQNLEKLSLKGCSSLVKIHSSIEHLNLNKLIVMDLRHCKSLKRLPPSMHLESLEELLLSGCSNLKKFPQISACKLKRLDLDETAIKELPPSIECLSGLVPMNILKYCSGLNRPPRNIYGLHSLTSLNMSDCGITELPESLGKLSSLKALYLQNNNFERMPQSIINLSKLFCLKLSYCRRLQYLPKLPCSINEMVANDCISLEALSSLPILFTARRSILYYQDMDLRNCYKLDGNKFRVIVDDALQRFESIATTRWKPDQVYNGETHGGHIYYPGSEIPGWFQFQSIGSSIKLPQGWFNDKFVGYALCVHVAFEEHHSTEQDFELSCNCWWHDDFISSWTIRYVNSDHVYLAYQFPLFYFGRGQEHLYNNELLIQFSTKSLEVGKEIKSSEVVKKCGIHFIWGIEETSQQKFQH